MSTTDIACFICHGEGVTYAQYATCRRFHGPGCRECDYEAIPCEECYDGVIPCERCGMRPARELDADDWLWCGLCV